MAYSPVSSSKVSTVEPLLSEFSVIRTLFRILNPKRQFDFLQNQVINEMLACVVFRFVKLIVP